MMRRELDVGGLACSRGCALGELSTVVSTGLRLRGDDAEAGDDVRLDGDDSVGVIYPRMEQLLIARDLVGIRESVRSARNDNAPARPTLRVETVGFIGDHHAIGESHGSGDRRGQPGADDYTAFVHQMINRADRRKRVEGKYHPPIA